MEPRNLQLGNLFMLAVCLISTATANDAFEVVWNGPSGGCNPQLSLSPYGIASNKDQAFAGSTITLFYKIGLFPTINATMNQTACWSHHVSGCSWNPWGSIVPLVNGGVPQAANLTAHLASLTTDVESLIPDRNFSGILVIDWEAWRPLWAELDDGLSSYREYSARLVRADPQWAVQPESAIQTEATRRFNTGAQTFFTTTVSRVRQLRPHARVGFYSQGINQPRGSKANADLLWLWEAVDVLCPSIYPRSSNVTASAESIANTILGAIDSANMVEDQANRPAVFPYARALYAGGVFTKGELATQVQVAAGLGAEGVIMWGSSGDYHNNGCAAIEKELTSFAGPTIKACLADRLQCSTLHCSGNGRCVDYTLDRLTETCLSNAATVTCRCSPGFTGPSCASEN